MNRLHLQLLLFISFVCIGIFFGGAHAFAANHYVNCTTGNDTTGDGSSGNPWLTIKTALTGSNINYGDTVYVSGGGSTCEDAVAYNPVIGGTPGTPTYIMPSDATIGTVGGSRITYTIPSTASSRLAYASDGLYWKNIDFVNDYSLAVQLFWWPGEAAMTFEDCGFNLGHGSTTTVAFRMNIDADAGLTLIRPTVNDVGTFISQGTASDYTDTITIVGGTFDMFYKIFNAGAYKATDLTFINNTVLRGEFSPITLAGSSTGPDTTAEVKNNIFVMKTDGTPGYERSTFFVTAPAASQFIATPSNWDVTNNIFWNTTTPASWASGDFNEIVHCGDELLPIDKSNRFIDPDFVEIGTDWSDGSKDLSLNSSTNITGRGLNSALLYVDHDGSAWTGNDIGAYANPSATPTTITPTTDTVAFSGDSIMWGAGSTSTKGYEAFDAMTSGVTVYGGTGRAIGGIGIDGFRFFVDYVMFTDTPETMMIANGLGNLTGPATNQTNAQLANEIIEVLEKVSDEGITPIWLGLESLMGNPPDNTNVAAVNRLVDVATENNGWAYGSILDSMSFNTDWKTDYYADLTADLHPNDDGHAVIAQLAENLYYDRYEYWIDDTTGAATGSATYQSPTLLATFNAMTDIYGGQSGRTIYIGGDYDLAIKPQNLSTTGQSQKMTITMTTWDTTGDQNKEWDESSTVLGSTNVLHTVGDLVPNSYYQFKIDGSNSTDVTGYGSTTCGSNGVCNSDASGNMQFVYTGGYSSQTFALEKMSSGSSTILLPPTEPEGGFVLEINHRASATNTPAVSLTLDGGTAARMAISNTPDFNLVSQEAYNTSQTWNLCWSDYYNETPTTCSDGEYTVYVKFYSSQGVASDIVEATITLNSEATDIEEGEEDKTEGTDEDGDTSENVSEVLALTIENGAMTTTKKTVTLQIGATQDVAEIFVTNDPYFMSGTQFTYSSTLEWNLCGGDVCTNGEKAVYVKFYDDSGRLLGIKYDSIVMQYESSLGKFTQNLAPESSNESVRDLQQFLNQNGFTVAEDGYGTPGNETTYFGSLTRAAVIRFQEAYAEQILHPIGLTRGTGFVGTMTRALINSLIGN
ncbi:peptidoglycan-binding protein [Patescibacteria group bacterium]|nr:peptidoglycan-binding protein [Patescibacteria group bacterium]